LVYEQLVREAAKLIPEEWTSAWVSLREAGIGIIEHHAAYQNPAEAAESAFTITYSLPALLAVEELLQLKKESGHPDWKQVTFRFEAAGTYHATFATQPATEQAPAAGYTYEGRWAPDAAAPFST
jgi:hypothetical protein